MMWEGDGTRCSATITDGSSSYTITGLQEKSSYIITVTATTAAGSATSHPVSIVTEEKGTYVLQKYDSTHRSFV